MYRKHHLIAITTGILLLAALACNAPISRQTRTATPGGSPEQPTTTLINPAVICPHAGDGTRAYVSQERGFCFLYPDSLTLPPGNTAASDSVVVSGPPYPPGAMEAVSPGLTVTYTGPAVYVSNSAEYASRWADIFLAEAPEKPHLEPISVNGQQAVMIRDLPGMAPSRTAFVVAGGYQYTISLSPDIGAFTALDPLEQKTWDTVTSSIVFFAPTLVKKVIKWEDVCSKAAADTQLLVNQADGFCFLAPADATPDPTFLTSGFEIGPTATHPEFPVVRVSLVVGTMGPAQGQTNPRDAVPGLLSSGVDPAAIQDITIDGKPAISYLNTNPPWVQRLAVVIANDTVYTINMNPYDKQQYPAMIPDADRLWDTAVSSLAFFTPFK